MGVPQGYRVGALRWPVWLVTRVQAPSPTDTGISETYENRQLVHASVEQLRPMTFWQLQGQQIDVPITHIIVIRWVDFVSNNDAVIRTTLLRDQTPRTETFRVRRVLEAGGRKQYAYLECELEQAI